MTPFSASRRGFRRRDPFSTQVGKRVTFDPLSQMTASSTLSLTQSASRGGSVYNRSSQSIITFTQEADRAGFIYELTGESILSITQVVDRGGSIYNRDGESAVTITDLAEGEVPSADVVSTRSINFDATDDYVDLNAGTVLTNGQATTITWWEKVKSGSGTYPSRFRLRCNSGEAVGIIRSSDANYAGLAIFKSGNDKKFSDCPSLASSVDVWRHFALVMPNGPKSGPDSDYTLYVDNVAMTASVSLGGNYGDDTICRIGYDGVDSPANCLMDDIRVYTRALTAGEVEDLYLNTGPTDTDLVTYWEFEEGTGTATADSIGSIDGTLTNGAAFSTDVPAALV